MRRGASLLLVLSSLLLGGADAPPPAAPPAPAPAAASPTAPAAVAAPAGSAAAATAPSTAPATAASPDASECKPRDGLRLLSESLALPPGSDAAAVARALVRADIELSFLHAMVPEPRLGFDGTVESLVRALETTGHTLDRYYLPWEASAERRRLACQEQFPGVALFHRNEQNNPPTPGQTAGPTGVQSVGSGPRGRLLLLYIIGESPLAGVHKAAFVRAIEQQQQLRKALKDAEPALALAPGVESVARPERCARCQEVRLVGPAFSGGTPALETLIDAFPTESFTILSGRATNSAIQHDLTRHTNDKRRVTMFATVVPDEALQTEFFCYLAGKLGADPHSIALITESSTGYGQAVIAHNAAPPHSPWARSLLLPGQKAVPRSKYCERAYRPHLTLPMPIHVSRLHTSLAKSSAAAPRPEPDSPFPSPVRLPRVLDETERTDVIPTLSERAVAATDRALAHVLSTLSAEKIRYVGIIATDIQDKLFLAQQIRQYCPDVVLFTFESDILYTAPEARPYLKGMLVVSPYPLFTRNQLWSYPFSGLHKRLQFSADTDQGVYNAAVALIDPTEPLLEYSQAAPGVDSPRNRPAIWISAVGNETLFPLAFIKEYDDAGYVYRSPDLGRAQYEYSPYQQGTLSLLLFVLGLGGVAISIGYFRVYYSRTRILRSPWHFLRVFRRCRFDFHLRAPLSSPELPASDGPRRIASKVSIGSRATQRPAGRTPPRSIGQHEPERQPTFFLVIFLPITICYFFLTLIHFMQLREGNLSLSVDEQRLSFFMRLWHHSGHLGIYHGMNWKVLLLGLFAAACEIVFILVALDLWANYFALVRRAALHDRLVRYWDRLSARGRLTLVGSAGLIFLLLTFALFWIFVALINELQGDFNIMLFLRRCAQPAFGLSPLLPLLLMIVAIQLWGYTHLTRIYLLERMTNVYLDVIAELEEEPSLRGHIVRVAAELESPSRGQVLVGAGVAALIAGMTLSELVTLEHMAWNILFRFSIAVLMTAIAYAFYRFLRLWLRVRAFLVALSHHPLSDAMGRMPAKLSRSLGMLLLGDMPEVTAHSVKQEHLQLLLNHMAQLDPGRELAPLMSVIDVRGDLGPELAELRSLKALIEPDAGYRRRRDEVSLNEEAEAEATAEPPEPGAEEEKGLMQASRLLAKILRRFWRARPLPGVLAPAAPDQKPSVVPVPAALASERNTADFYTALVPDALHVWLRLAEDLLAVQVVSYVNRLFPHLRNALLFCTFGFIAMLATFSVYPFQPLRFLMIGVWLFILVSMPITVYVLIQMNRDDILSRLGKSEPGQVTFDRRFLSQLVLYGVLPILSIIAAQFPEVRGVAFSWLESLLKTLK